MSGVVHIAFLPMNQAANSIDYKEQVKSVISKQGNNFCLHDDNARIHTSKLMQEFYVDSGLKRLGHPPYSPDLAPNEFG